MAKATRRRGKTGDTWQVQVKINRYDRKTIRFGAVSESQAANYAALADAIAEFRRKQGDADLPIRLAREVDRLPELIRDRFIKAGLVERPEEWTLAKWLEHYRDSRKVKPATKVHWRTTMRDLVGFFGESKRLRDMTRGDATRFREDLIGRGLSHSTVSKRLQDARQFFNAAVHDRLIELNPFQGVSHLGGPDKSRQRFITQQEALRLIEAAPNVDWRVMIALSRFGGLRCPSEVLSLKWEGFDFDRMRFRVDSPKTEHHPNGAYRIVPLFAELKPFIEEAWEAAEPGAVYVVANDRYRAASQGPAGWRNCNLRTSLLRIVKRAGLQPWPKAWHNLRASRETELLRRHPIKAVCEWIGNTPKIALAHYVQVTDEDFDRAVSGDTTLTLGASLIGCNSLQGEKPKCEKPYKNRVLQSGTIPCKEVGVGDTGLEPVTSAV